MFVVGGGELIYNDRIFFYTPLVRYTSIPAVAFRKLNFGSWIKHIKVPKVILGCGANVAAASELHPNVIRDLAQFDYIGLRDNDSVRILNSFPKLQGKVGLFYDLAFQLKINKHIKCHDDLAVVIPTDRNNLNTVVASRSWLTKQLEPYNHVTFLPFGTKDNNDYKTCKDLWQCSPNSVIVLKPTIDIVIEEISKSKTVYPYRLHGLILAYMCGVNYEFYPYHRKLNRVHETLTGCSVDKIRSTQASIFKSLENL